MSSAEFKILMERLDHLESLISGRIVESDPPKQIDPIVLTSFQKRCQESQADYLRKKERREARRRQS